MNAWFRKILWALLLSAWIKPLLAAFASVPTSTFFTRHYGTFATHATLGAATVVDGPILSPSLPSDPNPFDTGCVANPVVLPPSDENEKWQCYYYGNSGSWKDGIDCFLPTGWCGLAESDDGIRWTKIPGTLEGGSILAPEGGDAWDGVHLGVGDVIRVRPGELHMYYFGGSAENVMRVGIRMRIGRAKSLDGGRTWEKMGLVLDYDESEGLFASWPRIIVPEGNNGPWRMIYHAFNGQKWRVFGAESSDCGDTWTRTGLLLQGGEKETSFDSQGIGTRSVARWRDGMLMIYEGVGGDPMAHRLGAAYCNDRDGGLEWTKLESGAPIIEPGNAPLGPWTSQVVGTPYLVAMPDGSLRLYYCAKQGPEAKMAIGVVISDTGDIKQATGGLQT
jgi:hypothetical protein